MIDDTKLASLMTTFRATYNPMQVKYLNLFLDGNRLTNLNGLSTLSAYTNVIEFQLGLVDNQNLESVAGAIAISGN